MGVWGPVATILVRGSEQLSSFEAESFFFHTLIS